MICGGGTTQGIILCYIFFLIIINVAHIALIVDDTCVKKNMKQQVFYCKLLQDCMDSIYTCPEKVKKFCNFDKFESKVLAEKQKSPKL